jgi:hypothetical protein
LIFAPSFMPSLTPDARILFLHAKQNSSTHAD